MKHLGERGEAPVVKLFALQKSNEIQKHHDMMTSLLVTNGYKQIKLKNNNIAQGCAGSNVENIDAVDEKV